jgi:hypothetical protein
MKEHLSLEKTLQKKMISVKDLNSVMKGELTNIKKNKVILLLCHVT